MVTKRSAGILVRAVATFIDLSILVIIGGFIFLIVKGQYNVDWTTGATFQSLYMVYATIIPVIWGGYVLGKWICRIKLKRIDGGNVKLSNMIMREVVGRGLLGFITFGLSAVVSIFMIIFREDKRSIHDFIGGTYVSKN